MISHSKSLPSIMLNICVPPVELNVNAVGVTENSNPSCSIPISYVLLYVVSVIVTFPYLAAPAELFPAVTVIVALPLPLDCDNVNQLTFDDAVQLYLSGFVIVIVLPSPATAKYNCDGDTLNVYPLACETDTVI